MTAELVREQHETGSPGALHPLRDRDFPCSVLGALFGAHDFVEIPDVAARLRGEPQRPPTRSMRAGIWLHKILPGMVEEERPDWRIVEATTYHRLPDLRFGGTPDDWIYLRDRHAADGGVLEGKTINERSWYETHHEVPPLYWNLQLQGYLLLTGLPWGAIAVIVRNSDLPVYVFEVKAHPAAQAKILAAVAEFWRAFDAGAFPAAVPKDEIAAMLDDGSHVDLSAHNRLPEWLERREQLIAERLECERSIKGIDYEVKQRMGAASTGYLPGWQISFKAEHRKGYTVEPSDPRILRVKRTKEMDNEDS